jgi:hypothetical protein
MNQENIASKMAVRSKMADQNQIFLHNFESIQHFVIVLFALILCWTQVLGLKIKDGG